MLQDGSLALGFTGMMLMLEGMVPATMLGALSKIDTRYRSCCSMQWDDLRAVKLRSGLRSVHATIKSDTVCAVLDSPSGSVPW